MQRARKVWLPMVLGGLLVGLIAANAAGAAAPSGDRDKLSLWDQEVYEARRILLDEDSYPRQPAKLIEGPDCVAEGGSVATTFALDKPDDVLVRIVDSQGNPVRELACGVLGPNAPEPLAPGSLRQTVVWDGKDSQGKPAAKGCRVRVAIGLTPRWDRFVAHDPRQILDHVCGLEVDGRGRLYVTLFTDRRGDPHIVRFDREGNYLETVYPPNPNLLPGKLEDVYPHCDYVDGRAVPQRVGGPWPYLIYKYHSGDERDPSRFPSPLRITRDGRAFMGEPQTNLIESGLVRAEWDALGPVKARILPVELDPFWFLSGLTMGEGTWAADAKGFAYLCSSRALRKVALASRQPAEHFEYCGIEKLPQKQSQLGDPAAQGGAKSLFRQIRDLAVDDEGNLYVADQGALRVFRSNGQLVTEVQKFEVGGSESRLGEVFAVRAARDALYVTGRLDPIGRARWRLGQLVKFRIAPGGGLKAVWSVPLDGMANLVAVDEQADPRIVWVGNGGGRATFTRIVDHGDRPGEPRHCGSGVRQGVLVYPWAIAADGQGHLFAYDEARGTIVRTSEDGSAWLEGEPSLFRGTTGLYIDRRRERLYASQLGRVIACDRNLKPIPGVDFAEQKPSSRSGFLLGAVDRDGSLYVCDLRKGDAQRNTEPGLHGVVRRFGPDGKLHEDDVCRTFLVGGGLAMDSKGCLYVSDTARMGFMDAVHNWAIGRGPKWKRGEEAIRSQSDLAYLVKFPPRGGARGSDAEIWAHRGVSPVMGGGCQCPVSTNCVAVDEADRVFATDYIRYHVKVLDTAGNLIARIGAWGNADCQGPPSKYPLPEVAFGWVYSIAAGSDAFYASDKDLRRIVKVRLDYREVKEAPASL
ncbi:MAG: hypothetical protein ACOX1P_14925 [Thermoguttaceae bacterium]|jgi:sugar lactone lactonase YvrE